ncbi:hypothetical protein [Pseudomonas syringae]|uniref:hypothetical protein n=1 Tax=Pseudomonas syringae TaxID=317 RepID=UPI001F2CEFCC|nr:hypothetical protein [Pseudomonas syringae]
MVIWKSFWIERAGLVAACRSETGGSEQGARHRNLAWQSSTDQAEAPMLAQQNKGLSIVHEANRTHWHEQWQALEKNRDKFS